MNTLDKIKENLRINISSHEDKVFLSDYPHYLRKNIMNLLDASWLSCLDDMAQGDGKELEWDNDTPPKFCAINSSSALAVNAFAPFRLQPALFQLETYSNFTTAQFEKKMPTGLKGIPPNLDFYLESDVSVIGVESKFTEILSSKQAKFKESYTKRIDTIADESWRNLFYLLKKEPELFSYLDAAQLVKHYLGLINNYGKTKTNIVLLYVYWAPDNAMEIPEYRTHQDEINYFSDAIKTSHVKFISCTYKNLWRSWYQDINHSNINAHVSKLKQRYEFSI